MKRLGKLVPDRPIAESWELSVMPGNENRISNGELKGCKLTDVIKKYGRQVIGDRLISRVLSEGFPVLLKFIDANECLSIQVHPDDEYARKYESGKKGKTEMWFIIDAKPHATVIHGFPNGSKKDKNYENVLKCKHNGLYRKIKVKKEDVVFVPAGTVHALNDGIVVAEIQQPSDLTYRLFDYDRKDSLGKKRPLHVKKALDVLDFETRKALYQGLSIWNDKIEMKYLAVCRHFCVKLFKNRGLPMKLKTNGLFSVFMFINGEAEIVSGNEKVKVNALETVFIPAYLGSYRIDGEFSALQIFVPDSAINLYTSLIKEGFSHEEIIENVAGAESIKPTIKVAI